MPNGHDENESNKALNLVSLSENNGCNKNMKIAPEMEQYREDEDGQHMLIENNLLREKKTTLVENEKNMGLNLSWNDLYPQVFACFISLILVIQPGINLAYSNYLFYNVPSLNKGQLSWITSILALYTPLGAFAIGLVIDQIGRKKSCLLTCIPLLASWLFMSFMSPDSIYLYYVSRICAGIGGGMTSVSLVYVSEISHSSYKQLLLSLNSVFFSGGVLVATCLVHFNLKVISLMFVGITVVNFMLILIFMPESPIWLIRFKSSEYVDKAKAAMKRIYPKNDKLFKMEWNRLNSRSDLHTTASDKPSFIQSMRSNPAAYKPMIILLGLLLLQQLSGAYPIISYALPIIQSIETDDAKTASQVASLEMLGAIRFVSSLLTCSLSFYFGRKPLLIISCSGMVVSSALVAFAAGSIGSGLDSRTLWALCGIMAFVFSSSLGVLVFPWTLACELLSTSVRAIGGCLLITYAYLIMFVVFKVFPYVLTALSVTDVFLTFSAMSLLMAVYVYYAVPETLGKTFEEIDDYFTASRKNDFASVV